jgi:hypothetical protein
MIEKMNADFKENVTISIESKVFAKDKTKWPPNHYWSALIVRQSLLIFAPAFKKTSVLPIPDYKIIYRTYFFSQNPRFWLHQ